MRKFIFFIVLFLCLILLGIWSPWRSWNIAVEDLFGVESPEPIAGLRVFSLNGTLEVFIDGELEGTVSVEESPLIIDEITPGERLVTIKRQTEVEGAYWTFNRLVNFEEGISVVASYNLGPSKEFSEGHIIYVDPRESSTLETLDNLIFSVNTEDVRINVDGVTLDGDSKLYSHQIDLQGQKIISVTKSGFEPLEFVILPADQSERDKFADFIIYVDVQLMYQPISIDIIDPE